MARGANTLDIRRLSDNALRIGAILKQKQQRADLRGTSATGQSALSTGGTSGMSADVARRNRGSVSVSPAWSPTRPRGACRRPIRTALLQLLALLGALLIAGCATQPGSSLIDDLSKADLGEKHPQKVKQAGGPEGGRATFETYPGDDQFREKPTLERIREEGRTAGSRAHRATATSSTSTTPASPR